nr:immunoglobulin heavy chain junction region [Macaca mulatta]MOV90272.1 immunoglobulin heavy chain junction region [Macaca mulatta]MOV90962.1 immunoglobulin heavy chain junction region [Macaca mulatta]
CARRRDLADNSFDSW